MSHINTENIIETINMLTNEKLDIRTVTMGISLFDCIDSDGEKSRKKIYDKITFSAQNLVKESEKISRKYAVPIVNKRICVTPIAMIAAASGEEDYTDYAEILDKAAKAVGVDFIGGFSALAPKKMTRADQILMDSLPSALSSTDLVCASVNIGSTKAGINIDAAAKMGKVIKKTAELTRDRDSIGCAKLVVFCNAVDDNPFMAGAFHGTGQGDLSINIGISGPGTVLKAIEKKKNTPIDELCEDIKKTSFKITRMGQLIGQEVSKALGAQFGIVDLSLAPTSQVGDSVARILEEIGVDTVGGHGTTFALAMLNDSIKKGGLMASSHIGGLSGAFIPVSEDEGMIAAAAKGAITIDKLEAMTCVCSVGLDMIALPGDTPADTIAAMIADEAAIGMINAKTTAVRVIPVYGKKIGETAYFGDLLGQAPILSMHKVSPSRLINRGGFLPPPIHSFKN